MEESCDSVIKVVNIPFFEVEITRGVRWGNSQITHIFCVYRILSYHIHFFFILGEICRIFVSMKFYPTIHLYLGCLISLTSLWHG